MTKFNWQNEINNNITTANQLYMRGLIKENEIEGLQKIIERYPMSVTNYYLNLIKEPNLSDPIYKMSIASLAESCQDGSADTSGEASNTVSEGIQHKYDNTVLILSTNVCAMYCRHCFRKRLVGLSEDETLSFTDKALDYISEHPETDNVLVTGGDAFMNTNKVIERYLSRLSQIDHIKFIRFGTRTPVVFPQRISQDDDLLTLLGEYTQKKAVYVVTQFNHPNELTDEARLAIEKLRKRGVPVLNQTVLLHGINDDSEILKTLFNGLVEMGVSPYYLFHCRPVKGVKGFFAIPLLKGVDIADETKAKLSGVAKRFRYAMSHVKGKIEIIGKTSEDMLLLKQHQAKDNSNINKLFTVKVDKNDMWIPDNFTYDIL